MIIRHFPGLSVIFYLKAFFILYLPADVYREMVEVPGIMSYSFNVSDDEEANVEAFLGKYTEEVEPVMGYSSKAGEIPLRHLVSRIIYSVSRSRSTTLCLVNPPFPAISAGFLIAGQEDGYHPALPCPAALPPS